MVKKLVAACFFLACFELALLPIGWPRFGTFGFLVLINCFNVFLFLAYQGKSYHSRLAWAGTASLLAILASVISLFRANETIQLLMGLSSLTLTGIAFYLFTLANGMLSHSLEILLIPFHLVFGWLLSLKKFIFDTEPRYISYLFLGSLLSGLAIIFIQKPSGLGLEWFWINSVSRYCILFLIGLSLTNIRVFNGVSFRLQKHLVRLAYTETTIATLLLVVALATYFVLNNKYLFFMSTSTDIIGSGLNSIAQYTTRGFIEIILLTCLTYAIATLSFAVLNQVNHSGFELRILNLIIIGLVGIQIVSTAKRLFWYTTSYGFTNFRIYGYAVLGFITLICFMLAYRFLHALYVDWFVIESLGFLVTTFAAGILNFDHIIAQTATESPQIDWAVDYSLMAHLSADAVNGWVASYHFAQETISSLPLDEPEKLEQEQIEKLFTVKEISSQLRRNYSELAQRYGSELTITVLNQEETITPDPVSQNLLVDVASINIAEWHAYRLMNLYIYPEELLQMEQLAVELTSYVKEQTNFRVEAID